MINEGIHNHSSKKFANMDRDTIVVLVKACGTKRDQLWKLQKWAWNSRGFKSESFMLVCGISFLVLLSRSNRTAHGTKVFNLKWCIRWVLTTTENDVWMAKGTRLGFERGWWRTFYFTRMLRWNKWRYKLHLLEWVMVGMMLHPWDFWVSGRSSFPKLFI
jgi:hypothetical protein